MPDQKYMKQGVVPTLEERKEAIKKLTDPVLREILTKHLPKEGQTTEERPRLSGIEKSLPTGDRDE